MAKPFPSWTYDDAANAVQAKIALPKSGGIRDFWLWSSWSSLLNRVWHRRQNQSTLSNNPRRSDTAIRATFFYQGEHWQDGDGFIGQLPPAALPGAASMKEAIRKAFVADNVIKEVVETHVDGILGREPSWSFLPVEDDDADDDPESPRRKLSKETGNTLTRWWNDRQALADFQEATKILICEGTVVQRLFFPRGRVRDGKVTATRLTDALNFIYFETCYADQAGVFTDPETMLDVGVYLFTEVNQQNEVTANCAELSYLNDNGDTVCKIVNDKGAPIEYPPYPLGGRLLIYEINREALITEQIQSNQRALNLAHTQMIRNVNLAGNRQQTITNAQPPRATNEKPTITDDTTRQATTPTSPASKLFPGTFKTGAGAVNYVMGFPIYNDEGIVVGYTDPGINISDPVSVETFNTTIDKEKEAVYSQAKQRHVLIVDKADTSGRARETARREYERSLKKSKTGLDAAGRWKLETTLRLGAYVIGEVSRYAGLRADFNTLIDAGAPDPEVISMALQMRQPGGMKNRPLISDETARGLSAIEDNAAEEARIDKEATLPEAQLPVNLLPVPGQQTPKPATSSVN